ncbi:MAG: alanine dehydrogenase, partial [Armatimonadetes bacterium]|nr:alanine dehydrogenase [Armatimonadota bacterium]
MRIGIPCERKDQEYRVGITPGGIIQLVGAGHQVAIEAGAGEGSGISDAEFAGRGARITRDPAEVWGADMVMKVKEPLPEEFRYLRSGLVLFAYLHLAPTRELTMALLERRVVGIAYETVQLPDGELPLLTPMSEVAGRMAVQEGAFYLKKTTGGRGTLLGGVTGVAPSNVVVVGGGTVGASAARVAVGMGAQVTILEKNPRRMAYLDDVLHGRVFTLMSNPYTLEQTTAFADLLIGAVLIPGARAPRLVTETMVRKMKAGAVIVDVSIDQGGCVETIRPTSHSDPVYPRHGVIHYGVTNMPGAMPRTSTFALTNATIGYALAIARHGWQAAVREDPALALGVNVADGAITYRA